MGYKGNNFKIFFKTKINNNESISYEYLWSTSTVYTEKFVAFNVFFEETIRVKNKHSKCSTQEIEKAQQNIKKRGGASK